MFSNGNQIENNYNLHVVEYLELRNVKKKHFVMPPFSTLLRQYEAGYCTQFKSCKVSKGANIRIYNQVPHLTQDTNGKVTNSQLDTTKEGQEVSPFPAGDSQAHINRRSQRHTKHMTEKTHKRSTKEVVETY